MPAETILERLEGVQRSGRGWRACCPACSKTSRSRKLAISDSDDGRVLLHCFAGCDAAAIVQAAGLTLGDLFPERLAADTPEDRRRRQRAARESQWGAALDALCLESKVVWFSAADVSQGIALSSDDTARLKLAIDRIDEVQQILRPRPPWRPEVRK